MPPVLRHFSDDGETPNHPQLPVVIQHLDDLGDRSDPAGWLEQTFTRHGWTGTWRWGVYPFHHFHTTDHEVLGVFAGNATLQLGGKRGERFEVTRGDVIVLPAGTGHKCLEASPDFQVVGAYPQGDSPDLVRSGEGDLEAARERILQVPLPENDPVHGADGPLIRAWTEP
ncbi:hypothetical protein [Haloferula sargassicola]|uniref:Cupin domain-containing protein n=1 Tax=Haloferula sargassicola TaxID=490096 RepID=A0ABP9UN10_9BACT